VRDGVLTQQEAHGYVDERGYLTPEAKDRIGKMIVGRWFESPAEFSATPPERRNKLERIASHVLRVKGRESLRFFSRGRRRRRGRSGNTPHDKANQTNDYHPRMTALHPVPLEEEGARIASAFVTNASGMELVARVLGLPVPYDYAGARIGGKEIWRGLPPGIEG